MAEGGGFFGLLATMLIGLFVGVVAKLLMPGRDPGGFIVTILLGIAGSWVGAWLFGLLGWGSGFIGSVIGAMLLLFAYRQLKGAG
jgi:uncharacterized membrane protein YeaQ/YmgE (transglycosylase-associated protein family)